ncbi:hypothetical protein [Saccharospirillum alexandrii]|uniref:hypothetical protein n=1 Tax=Saccharospirillum alexandrii TaxID=2448477 RepID=UPI000FD78E3F|nr:hypothetical protein [Saccharospirillum alexandrii]
MEPYIKALNFVFFIVIGRFRYLWPNWRCTQTVTEETRPSRKREKLKRRLVTPQERYQHHTPFYTDTDGKQWVVQCNSNYIQHQSIAVIAVFFGLIWITLFFPDFSSITSIAVAFTPVVPAFYFVYLSRTGGEDTWVVFDRTTGNVCFWKRDAEHSLTVPFEKVNCYWIEVFRRGISHSLYFMPTENLPNERHRWWQVMFGTATTYEQAQYFWRVLTDFMDPSKPIPSVPGLSHQLYFVNKHGYTIEDLTEGKKEITFEDFEEAEAQLSRTKENLENEMRRMLEPECFDVQAIIDFYNKAPWYAQNGILSTAVARLDMYVTGLEDEKPFMCPLFPDFKKLFTFDEYKTRVEALADYFFKIHKELNPSYSYVDRRD